MKESESSHRKRFYERLPIPDVDRRSPSQKKRDRIFYSLVLGLISDYESLVLEKYRGAIPELDDPREIPGAHGALIIYNCSLGSRRIDFYDAERWDDHDVEGLGTPLSVDDIPEDKEGALDFVVNRFYGENARIFIEDMLIYPSAKMSNIAKLEGLAKKELRNARATASDLVWYCMGGAKEPDARTGKYGTRTLAAFASAYLAGGHTFMRDTTRKNEVTPGQVYEFGLDGLLRSATLVTGGEPDSETSIDLDNPAGYGCVQLVLTEYARDARGEVRPVRRYALLEEDVLSLLSSQYDELGFWDKLKRTGERMRRALRRARRNR